MGMGLPRKLERLSYLDQRERINRKLQLKYYKGHGGRLGDHSHIS